MPHTPTHADPADTPRAFHDAVNMTAGEMEKWLATPESQEVGWKAHEGDAEAIGHESGRRIVQLLRTKRADYAEDDYAQMRRVVSYVHRHMAQRPNHPPEELAHMRWRYSLMNWGHDPLKADR